MLLYLYFLTFILSKLVPLTNEANTIVRRKEIPVTFRTAKTELEPKFKNPNEFSYRIASPVQKETFGKMTINQFNDANHKDGYDPYDKYQMDSIEESLKHHTILSKKISNLKGNNLENLDED